MSVLEISLFGKLTVRREGSQLDLPSKVAELLCVLLLRKGQPCTRELLATTLWGDASPAQGKKYLRQTLWQLQQALESNREDLHPFLRLEHEWVAVRPEATLLVDVYQLDEACAWLESPPDGDDLAQAGAAAELYAGELLEGWYQEWCVIERERYHALYITLLEGLLEHCIAQRKVTAGLAYGLRLLRLEPSRERAHRGLMRLYALSGDRGAALNQLERCRAVLEREFGVGPGATTMALANQIRAGAWPRRRARPPSQLRRAVAGRGRAAEAGCGTIQLNRPAKDAPTDTPTDARMLGSQYRSGPNHYDAATTLKKDSHTMQVPPPEPGSNEPTSHAFVVRVWREEGRPAVWRGQITHVSSGARRSVTQLEQLSLFMCEYLTALQVVLPLVWRLRHWLDQRQTAGPRP